MKKGLMKKNTNMVKLPFKAYKKIMKYFFIIVFLYLKMLTGYYQNKKKQKQQQQNKNKNRKVNK